MNPVIVPQNEKLNLIILDDQKDNKIQIQAEDDSGIKLFILNSSAPSITARLKNNVELEINFASLYQKNSKHEIKVTCLGNNSKTIINTVFLTKTNEQQDLKISNIFEGQNNTGSITINGILEDQTRCSLEGRVVIKNTAIKTESNLHEKILLLGEKSVCNAKPILQIDTDDVKANHSASTGRISQEDLFYMRSRGLSEQEAEKLIKQGLLLAPFSHLDKNHKFFRQLETRIL